MTLTLGFVSRVSFQFGTTSRQAAYKVGAISRLREMHAAEERYRLSDGNGSYGDVESLIRAKLLDGRLSNATNRYVDVGGYVFELSSIGANYIATAAPARPDFGRYGYYVTSDGLIRHSLDPRLSPPGQAGTATK